MKNLADMLMKEDVQQVCRVEIKDGTILFECGGILTAYSNKLIKYCPFCGKELK